MLDEVQTSSFGKQNISDFDFTDFPPNVGLYLWRSQELDLGVYVFIAISKHVNVPHVNISYRICPGSQENNFLR